MVTSSLRPRERRADSMLPFIISSNGVTASAETYPPSYSTASPFITTIFLVVAGLCSVSEGSYCSRGIVNGNGNRLFADIGNFSAERNFNAFSGSKRSLLNIECEVCSVTVNRRDCNIVFPCTVCYNQIFCVTVNKSGFTAVKFGINHVRGIPGRHPLN